jgi:hypothetical protein
VTRADVFNNGIKVEDASSIELQRQGYKGSEWMQSRWILGCRTSALATAEGREMEKLQMAELPYNSMRVVGRVVEQQG